MEINIFTVLESLGIPYDDSRDNFNMYCPKCSSGASHNRKTLNINFSKEAFNCPRCNTGGGFVDLYAFIKYNKEPRTGFSFRDLLEELNTGKNKSFKGKSMEQFKKDLKLNKVELLDINQRDKSYNYFLKTLTLSTKDRDELLRRGLDKNVIEENGYKSIPFITGNIDSLRGHGLQLEGVPGFFREEGKWKINSYGGGFYIPFRDIDGRIQGFQIRANLTEQDKKNGKPKYFWLSSGGKDKGSSPEAFSHFQKKKLYDDESEIYESVILTEGGLKADIISHFLDTSVIGIPGVNALGCLSDLLDQLKKRGCRRVYTAFDMDYLSNPYVNAAYNDLMKILLDKGLNTTKLNWEEVEEGVGFDDFLLNLSINDVERLNNLKNFFA